MEFLNSSLAQLKDLFRSMTPAARVTTALLLAAVAISLVYLFNYRGTAADLYLMNGEAFTPSQLPAMQAAFAKAGLNTYQFEGPKIRIPRGEQSAYMAALAENNALPENYSTILDKALESGPWVSREQRDQKLRAGRQKQLEMIIRSMTGIESAFVIYDSDTKRGFQKEAVATASVNVTPAAGHTLGDGQVLAIRTLVARSVAGLKPESVAVTDLSSGQTLVGGGEGGAGSLEDPYGARKKMYERQWTEKVRDALRYVQGVTVTANVELDRELSNRKESVKYDAKTVPYTVSEKSQTSSTEGSTPGGRPGYPAQQPNTSLSLSAQGKSSKETSETSESQTTNLAPGDHVTVESVGLTPKRVTMSIGVPMSYFLKLWQERNPQSGGKAPEKTALDQISTEEITKIKSHVAKLLPQPEGTTTPTDGSDLVQVTPFQDITSPEPALPGTGQNLMVWLSDNWTTLGMIALAVVALAMLRSLIRSMPAAVPAATALAAATAEQPEPEEAMAAQEKAPGPRLRRFTGGGPSLRDELSHMVQEDPEAAANVLRTWIGAGQAK